MEELTRLLRRLNERMDGLDTRLGQFESSKLILDERKVVAGERELEGKTYLSREDGGIVKEVRVPVCDACGRGCEKFNACTACGRKLCEECSYLLRNRVYCVNCLGEELPLTKREFKVLLAVAQDVSLRDAADLAKMKKDELAECEKNLVDKRMLDRKGFLFFRETAILEDGLEALAAYDPVYAKQGDVQIFKDELRRFLDGED